MNENKTTEANPSAQGYIFWNLVRLLSPSALPHVLFHSLVCNPLKHPSFLAVIFFPCCLPLRALSRFLCSSPQPSICLPPALPQLLFGELFISLYVINQHLFKRYDWGAVEVEDRRRDIDRW